jgi:integrase
VASAERLPSGKWRGVYRDAAGNKQNVKGTFERKTDAREAAQEAEVKARRKVAAATGNLSARTKYRQWLDTWWPERNLQVGTDDTEVRIRDTFLITQWGESQLNAIGKRVVQPWVNSLARKHSPGYVARIYGVFRASILAAVELEVLDANPLAGVKLPTVPKTSRRHFEQDEIDLFLPKLRLRHRQVCEFLMDTGLRPGEFAGLHHSRVRGGWITVADVLVDKGRAIKSKPKDEDAREVPLTTRAQEILDEWKEAIPPDIGCEIPHANGKACRSDLIFRQHNGSPLSLTSFRDVLTRALTKVGIPDGTLYSLRHTYGSRLAENGLDVFEISRLMGHEDINMSKTYVHRTTAARGRILAALGDPAATGLTVVGRGTPRGTDPGNQALSPTPIQGARRPA